MSDRCIQRANGRIGVCEGSTRRRWLIEEGLTNRDYERHCESTRCKWWFVYS